MQTVYLNSVSCIFLNLACRLELCHFGMVILLLCDSGFYSATMADLM